MILDLLVLWRGNPGWLATPSAHAGQNRLFAGPGFPDRAHQVWVRGRKLELRVDSKTNRALIQGHEIPLNGVNVVMIDDVDKGKVRITGVMWVDPQFPPPGESELDAMLKQSRALQDFVRGR